MESAIVVRETDVRGSLLRWRALEFIPSQDGNDFKFFRAPWPRVKSYRILPLAANSFFLPLKTTLLYVLNYFWIMKMNKISGNFGR